MPEGWAWCRLGEIGDWKSGSTPNRKKIDYYENGTIPWLLTGDLNDDYITQIPSRITDKAFKETSVKLNQKDSVCIAMYGATIGKLGILTFPATSNQACCICSDFRGIQNKYLFFFLMQHKDEFIRQGFGGAQPNISKEKIVATLIPIPPMEEQIKIVKTIDNLFEKIDSLNKNTLDLQTTIKQAKSKILDLAIHGKLVPQDPNDEPAEELLKRIATSDNRPYKKFEGEEPFEIPDSWAWCTGNDIFNPMTSKKPYGETFRYIDIDAIDNKKHCIIQPKTIAVSEAPSRASRELNNGNVLFSLVRPYLENIALIEKENSDCIASTGFYVCKPKDFIFPKFLFYLMTSEYVLKGLNQFMKGDNSPSINGDDIKNWLYPLPPLAEQKRIVSKIEELFAQLDSISEQLA